MSFVFLPGSNRFSQTQLLDVPDFTNGVYALLAELIELIDQDNDSAIQQISAKCSRDC
jgi:hypothetical protein